jgi:Glycosyl transferase family 90
MTMTNVTTNYYYSTASIASMVRLLDFAPARLMIYHPSNDTFLWYSIAPKSYMVLKGRQCGLCDSSITLILRTILLAAPWRFQSNQPPFQLLISDADFSYFHSTLVLSLNQNKSSSLHDPTIFAPMLQFGSVLKDTTVLPSVKVYPFPPYLKCLDEWYHTKTKQCTTWEIIPSECRLGWNNLTSQIIWRGRMYQFLESLDVAFFNQSNLTQIPVPSFLPRQVAMNMSLHAKKIYEIQISNLTLITNNQSLPWLDIQDGNVEYMSRKDMAKYRYQIDFGGAGGTTWTGTLDKLAMPGLLFHHETPAKDWYYDNLIPWKHYIPIRTDLSDLFEKYQWAVKNDREARSIAAAGTQFANELLSSTTMAMYYEMYFGNNSFLSQLIEWYIPTNREDEKESLGSILDSYTNHHSLHVEGPFATCDKVQCKVNFGSMPVKVRGNTIFQWQPPKQRKRKAQNVSKLC